MQLPCWYKLPAPLPPRAAWMDACYIFNTVRCAQLGEVVSVGFVCSLFVLFAQIGFYFGISTVNYLFFGNDLKSLEKSAVGDRGSFKTKQVTTVV